ncbi:MAG: N-acetyltransferase [Acidimicrobiia bacterium]|nr:N-acetyltransferase [Acidimicrobiia bacterium]
MTTEVTIKPETADDQQAIYDMNVAAFDGRVEEADLVDALRTAGDLLLSLVAWHGDQIVGHVAFSRVTIDGAEGPEGGVALAPVGVQPEHQNCGVGTRLIEAGIGQLAELGESVVLVVGNPAYYTRFGFSIEQGTGYPSDYSGNYYMALLLDTTSTTPRGPVRYPDAFALVT